MPPVGIGKPRQSAELGAMARAARPLQHRPGMVEIVEIDDPDELAGYRLAWSSWLPQTPRATFFNTWDWLDIYWRHFGGGQRLRALVARSESGPIGVLPLCVRTERRAIGRVRVVTDPLDGWGTWFGPVGSNRAVATLAAMQHLRSTRRDWDIVDLRSTGPPGSDGGRVARSMRVVGLLSEARRYQTTSVIDLRGDWASYLARKSRPSRHEIRRRLRRTSGDDRVEYIRHRPAPAREGDGDPRWDLFAMCEHVALASWQAASSTGTTLTDPRVRAFFRECHAAAARAGMVDVNLLLVDGRPVAFIYNYHFQGRLTGVRMGYDAAYGRGLGSALMLRSIAESFARGDESYDLGPGEAPWKRSLRTHGEANYRLSYWPLGSFKSQAVRLAQWARRSWSRPGEELEKKAPA